VRGKYLVLEPSAGLVRLVRYSVSSSFPISMRGLKYCPFCSKSFGDGNVNHNCLPFKAASTPEKGYFVCRLDRGLAMCVLFNLVPDDETVPQGSLEPTLPTVRIVALG
jgi:hypothetical protein